MAKEEDKLINKAAFDSLLKKLIQSPPQPLKGVVSKSKKRETIVRKVDKSGRHTAR